MTLEQVRDALKRVLDKCVTYNGERIISTFASPEEAMIAMRDARQALVEIEKRCAQ